MPGKIHSLSDISVFRNRQRLLAKVQLHIFRSDEAQKAISIFTSKMLPTTDNTSTMKSTEHASALSDCGPKRTKAERQQALAEAKQRNANLRLRIQEMKINGERVIREKKATIAAMKEQVERGHAEIRRLHNIIQELRGNIRVFARVRPLAPSEGTTSAITCHEDERRVTVRCDEKTETFKFDHVFPPTASQQVVFQVCGVEFSPDSWIDCRNSQALYSLPSMAIRSLCSRMAKLDRARPTQ
jgi:hypothetical protein